MVNKYTFVSEEPILTKINFQILGEKTKILFGDPVHCQNYDLICFPSPICQGEGGRRGLWLLNIKQNFSQSQLVVWEGGGGGRGDGIVTQPVV
jgi:hypothetical protein